MKQPQRILIMGLPGAGKTYLAAKLKEKLSEHNRTVGWLNADEVRKHYNDWDFSREGRIRQSLRMRDLADTSNTDYCIVDFVAPLPEMRHNYKADWTVWVDTIDAGRYEDSGQADYASGHTAYVASITVNKHLANGAAHLGYNQHLRQDITLVSECVM